MTHLWFSHHIVSKGLATNMIYHWRICYWHDWSNVCQVSLLWSCLSHHFSYCALWKEFIVYCSYWKGVSSILLSGGVSSPWEICLFTSFIYYIIYLYQYELMDIYFCFLGFNPNGALFILYQFFPALSIGSSFTWFLWPIHICVNRLLYFRTS